MVKAGGNWVLTEVKVRKMEKKYCPAIQSWRKAQIDSVINVVVPRSHMVCLFNIDLPEAVIVRIACSGYLWRQDDITRNRFRRMQLSD